MSRRVPALASVIGAALLCVLAGAARAQSLQEVYEAARAYDASYLAAPQAQQSFAVGLQPQTISFTSTPRATASPGPLICCDAMRDRRARARGAAAPGAAPPARPVRSARDSAARCSAATSVARI